MTSKLAPATVLAAHDVGHIKSRVKLLREPGRSPDSRIIVPELPSQSFYPSDFLCSGSPRLQWRGPCRDRTGFPKNQTTKLIAQSAGKRQANSCKTMPKARRTNQRVDLMGSRLAL